jgi:hypothetical protein
MAHNVDIPTGLPIRPPPTFPDAAVVEVLRALRMSQCRRIGCPTCRLMLLAANVIELLMLRCGRLEG